MTKLTLRAIFDANGFNSSKSGRTSALWIVVMLQGQVSYSSVQSAD